MSLGYLRAFWHMHLAWVDKAPVLSEFWDNILQARDANRDVPEGRWVLSPSVALDPSGVKPDKVYSTRGCFIEDFKLDPGGLNIEQNLLTSLDLLHHYVLHAGRNAFQDAVTD